MRLALVFLLLAFLYANSQTVDLKLIASDFNSPTAIAHAKDSRLFITEKAGIIKILNDDGSTNETPFLDITNLTEDTGEQGLLGLAFHPNYTENGYFFINYTDIFGHTIVARFSRSNTNENTADPNSMVTIIDIPQPYSNHNGGCIKFGPDGYLYIGMGDGGSAGDPQNHAQNLNSLLGKMLRIDINQDLPYTIPNDNPYIGANDNQLDEIWASGLRNPWRFSFDRQTGNLWIADVGQGEYEEINFANATTAGVNYGWKCYEGNHEFDLNNCSGNYTFPIAEYHHTNNGLFKCSITGGYVYRGTEFPDFIGTYFFTDYCSDEIGTLTFNNDSWGMNFTSPFSNNNFSTFGEDYQGELYVAGLTSGKIFQIIDSEQLSIEDNNPEKKN